MNHVFIGMSVIIVLADISTFLGIMMQIMLMLGNFWKLRCGTSLSKTYSTSQENNYLAPFIIYTSNSVKSQSMLENITSLSPSSCHFFPTIESSCITALQVMFIGSVILSAFIENCFKFMFNCTYHWIQDDGHNRFARCCNACHYREKNIKYFMLSSYGAQAARGLRMHSPHGLTPRLVFIHKEK